VKKVKKVKSEESEKWSKVLPGFCVGFLRDGQYPEGLSKFDGEVRSEKPVCLTQSGR
jgi:hypothetical protein